MLKLTVVTATLSFNVLPLTLATAMLNVNVLPLKVATATVSAYMLTVSVGNTVVAGTPSVDNSKEVPIQLSDVLSKHTEGLQKMLQTFQSNTVHSLER